MKWTEKNSSAWDKFKSWSAKYKKFQIQVSEGSADFSRLVEYYWFYVKNEKTDTRQNSLWFDGKYKTLEEAQEAAVKWIDEYNKQDKMSL